MKFTIEKTALHRALKHANAVVEKRNTMLILANILIETAEDRIRIIATDLEMEVVEEVAAEIIEPGSTTVHASVVFEYVGKLDDGAQIEVKFDSEKDRIFLNSGKSSFEHMTMPADEFPLMEMESTSHQFSMPSNVLRDILKRSRFAMSREESRYYLNGVYIHPSSDENNPKLRMVATDSHRLARVETDLPEGAAGMPGVIVPRKTINDIVTFLEEGEGRVHFLLTQNKIRFEIGDLTVTSKLIDGTYPNYETVIPKDNDLKVELDAKQIRTILDRVSTISVDRNRIIKMTLNDNKAIFNAIGNDGSMAEDEMDVNYEGRSIAIGYNSTFMAEILGHLTENQAHIYLKDEAEPMLIIGPDDPQTLYILMPLRVN